MGPTLMKTPKTLGRYQIIKELGRGGMGVVLQGKDPKIDRHVALKILRLEEDPDSNKSSTLLERFLIEAKAAGRLTHPSIVTIYDVGEEDGLSFIAMEYIEGRDLARVLDEDGRIPLERAIKIITQIAEGLAFAHDLGIVHRDIKPGNILLHFGDKVKITDFGIARLQSSQGMTKTGLLIGTPSYCSPEQVKGKKIDGRSDIFSLGVMFYELITAKHPFKGEELAATIMNIVEKDPVPVSQINPLVPHIVEKMISKMLAKNPDERYLTCQDVIRDIRKFDSGARNQIALEAPTEIEAPTQIKKPEKGESSIESELYDFDKDSTQIPQDFPKKSSKPAYIALLVILMATVVWFLKPEWKAPQKSEKEAQIATTDPSKKLEPVKSPVAATPEAPTTAMVKIVSSVEGEILVDGKPMGTTPLDNLELPSGEHVVEVRAKGAQPWTQKVSLKAGENLLVSAKPEQLKASLKLTTIPRKAKVSIDGKDVGHTPIEISDLAPGSHEITIRRKGFRVVKKELHLSSDKPNDFKIKLKALTGALKVDAPPGSTVHLDGQNYGNARLFQKIIPGTHKLVVSRKGFASYAKSVKIQSGKTTRITAQLEQLKGILELVSPPGTSVSLNGKPVGQGSFTKELVPGEYKIKVEMEGHSPFGKTVFIQGGKKKKVRAFFQELTYGSLRISAIPWATVYLNGEKTGTTPQVMDEVLTGKIVVKLVNPNYHPYEKSVTLNKGQTLKIIHKFTQAESLKSSGGRSSTKSKGTTGELSNVGVLKVFSKPSGNVFVDGKLVGKTPVDIRGLEPGPHHVVVKRKGMPDYKHRVVISGGVVRLVIE